LGALDLSVVELPSLKDALDRLCLEFEQEEARHRSTNEDSQGSSASSLKIELF
jgi:hypothetical protein